MRKIIAFILLSSFCFFISCNVENKENNKKTEIDLDTDVILLEEDETLINVADLPVKFDSIPILIHPLGYYSIGSNGKYFHSKSSDNNNYNTISNFYNDEIYGEMTNLLFENLQSKEIIKLTEKKMIIRKVVFLRDLFNNTKDEVLIYDAVDTDTNKDKKLDFLDESSLFVSSSDGSNFKKLSKINHQLLAYKFIKANNTLYFKTSLSEEEKIIFHYYQLDLSSKQNVVKEYFPIN